MEMNNKETRRVVIGITAHVDAGKTTLAEAMLYRTGQLRKLGRVDHGSAAMDSHLLERERGITIFLSQAELPLGDMEVTLLDTPGHVDFSAEMERTLSVLDYAILVISGVDGVQAHTRTLWRLLELYRVPTFLFVTKMDFGRRDRDCLMENLRHELGEGCIDFTPAARDRRMEQLATCREDALEAYLDTGMVPEELVRQLVRQRLVFPCWFGSGLKLEGIDEFLEGLARYVEPPAYPAAFSARVFKISHDAQGKRLTHLKVTGGTLRVRDAISYGGRQEKAAQLRIYTGGRFRPVDQVPAGGICAVQGLTATWGGQGLGEREEAVRPVLEPVMRYRMALPPDCDSRVLLPQLRQLEEEDPQLRFTARDGELHVSLMGRVQAEILRSLVAQRFGVEVELDRGRVLYKETIDAPVEGVGHYEPLRHYAEVHLLLEPLPQGSGLVLATRCPEDDLDRSWQRLIMTHLQEKTHLGVLTGSPVTDMKITLMSGRAHIKHTEGGDFRQATYRAVRQGLMQAKSRLLEPYYAFRLEVPPEQLGRAISDVRLRSGSFDAPEEAGDMTLLRGRVPVTEFDDYAQEVASYTGGRGRLSLEPAGYGPCHNPDAVIAAADYDPEADLENTPDSVFCAHGGGFPVKWNRVAEYMHLPGCLEKPREDAPVRRRCIRLDDAELEAIMAREFGPVRRPLYRAPEKRETLPDTGLREIGQRYYVVDGYNVIFDWDELHALADRDLSAARERLMDTLCGWAAFTRTQVVLVFDGYKVPGSLGEKLDYRGIHVVYTKERETGDMYIERFLQQVGKNDHVRVVTSDGLIQLSAVRTGVMRMSSAEFGRQVAEASDQIQAFIARMHQSGGSTIGQRMKRAGK
jgi:ribosomal protection tetracycline resistance protein